MSINSLPESLLVSILVHLPLRERYSSASLVCRRWRDVINSSAPQLLHSVSIEFGGDEQAAGKLDAFCGWVLARAAGHVQQLDLAVDRQFVAEPDIFPRLTAAATAIVVGCGTAGSLRHLHLHGSVCCWLPSYWASGLHGLHSLLIWSTPTYPLIWDPVPHSLPGLEELALAGYPLDFRRSAHLPTSLIKLRMMGGEDEVLPRQMTALTRLRELEVLDAYYCADGYSLLERLPSLRRLALRDCSSIPACLSLLTGLEALAIFDEGYGMLEEEDEEAPTPADILAAALPHLRQLTYLALDSLRGDDGPSPSLTSLTGLRSFFWLGCGDEPLPAGPWLSSVRLLVSSAGTVANSLPALQAAIRLEHLGVHCHSSALPAERAAGMLHSVSSLPALRCLTLNADESFHGQHIQAIVHAQRLNPAMCIECLCMDSEAFFARCGHDRRRVESDSFYALPS